MLGSSELWRSTWYVKYHQNQINKDYNNKNQDYLSRQQNHYDIIQPRFSVYFNQDSNKNKKKSSRYATKSPSSRGLFIKIDMTTTTTQRHHWQLNQPLLRQSNQYHPDGSKNLAEFHTHTDTLIKSYDEKIKKKKKRTKKERVVTENWKLRVWRFTIGDKRNKQKTPCFLMSKTWMCYTAIADIKVKSCSKHRVLQHISYCILSTIHLQKRKYTFVIDIYANCCYLYFLFMMQDDDSSR